MEHERRVQLLAAPGLVRCADLREDDHTDRRCDEAGRGEERRCDGVEAEVPRREHEGDHGHIDAERLRREAADVGLRTDYGRAGDRAVGAAEAALAPDEEEGERVAATMGDDVRERACDRRQSASRGQSDDAAAIQQRQGHAHRIERAEAQAPGEHVDADGAEQVHRDERRHHERLARQAGAGEDERHEDQIQGDEHEALRSEIAMTVAGTSRRRDGRR